MMWPGPRWTQPCWSMKSRPGPGHLGGSLDQQVESGLGTQVEMGQEERGRPRWACAAGSMLKVIAAMVIRASFGTSVLPVGAVIRPRCVEARTSPDKADQLRVTDGLLWQ